MTTEAGEKSSKGVEQVASMRDRDHSVTYEAYADDLSRLWGVLVVWPTTDPVMILDHSKMNVIIRLIQRGSSSEGYCLSALVLQLV